MGLSKKQQVLRAIALSIAVANAAVVVTALSTDFAHAGKSNGKSGDKGKSADRGNSSNTPASTKSAAAKSTTKPVAAKSSSKKSTGKNRFADLLGVHPSELGALNAANASATALANAAPGSRVGLINIYAQEVLATHLLEDDLAAKLALLEGLVRPDMTSAELSDAIALKEGELSTAQGLLQTMQQQLSEQEVPDPILVQNIADLEISIGTMQTDIAEMNTAMETAILFEDADAAEALLDDQRIVQRDALDDAANKDISDAIEAAVQKMLGIYREPVL